MVFSNLRAQLSPGPLHQSHAAWEGVENCGKCHSPNKKAFAEKCLACHSFLKEQIQNSKGLHRTTEYKNCQECHVEHQGLKYDLVWWERGMQNFDHTLTGYVLEGKHQKLLCRACHKPELIANSEKLKALNLNLSRTFMGLESMCTNCHTDEHRGQFVSACVDCHNQDDWKPVPGFDHNRTDFVLTGKHFVIACAKCHMTVVDNRTESDSDFVQFTGISGQNCTSCHKDVHSGRLGTNCQKCHGTESWRVKNQAAFDHNRTRYPLMGRHRQTKCQSCHQPGSSLTGLKFDRCRDCHSDYHRGEFVSRSSKGVCEECHTLSGFSPTLFTIAQHQESDYPLQGAHLAVPCLTCHQVSGKQAEMRFVFSETGCRNCHANPHGRLNQALSVKGCELCHPVDSWKNVGFDHGLTQYPLEGKHLQITCQKCHAPVSKNNNTALVFESDKQDCQDCHQDIHQGQFRLTYQRKGATDCQACHATDSWKAEKFDHNRQASFKLEGAHKVVLCRGCHKPIQKDGMSLVLYKPLDSACKSCHDDSKSKRKVKNI